MKAIILAGGLGSRLLPFTEKIPKAILPIGKKPLCFYQLEWLKKYGIREIIFTLGYLGEKIKEVFKNNDFSVNISWVEEDTPLGTAGAIGNVFKKMAFSDKEFIVLNGDILTDIDLSKMLEFHSQKNSLFTLALILERDISSYGVVRLNEEAKVISFYEKPNTYIEESLVNVGIYIMNRKILEFIPQDNKPYSLEKELIPQIIKMNLNIYGFRTEGFWIDVGTIQRYKEAQEKDFVFLF